MVCPSNRNLVSGSECRRARRSSTADTRRGSRMLSGRYHSRSQCVCGIRWKVNPVIAGTRAGSVVASEGLDLTPGAGGTMLEDVGNAESGGEAFDPAFE